LPAATLALSACQRHAFETELLHAIAGAGHVKVAFLIGGDLVPASQHTRALNAADDLERLAIDDRDFLSIADVEELLLRVRRQRQVARKRRIGLDQLLYELAVVGEHLHAPVFPI